MRPLLFAHLCALARRECGDASAAEDVVQEALLAAVRARRDDVLDPVNARWLRGVVRNQARMVNRAALRRRQRDAAWQRERADTTVPATEREDVIAALPPALRVVAALVLTGHNRREIAWLLRLDDAALRQRVVALKRKLREAGIEMPREFIGLNLDLAYGRIRDALLPELLRQGGTFASHDPDGHLFVVRRSQNP